MKVTVGMMHYRRDPRTLFKAYAYAAAAKMEGVDFFYFTPGRVDFETRTILAWFYEDGAWVERETSFPDVIYNSGGSVSEKTDEVIERLFDEIPYTSHSVGDKVTVYNRLLKGRLFAKYLLPTHRVRSEDDVLDKLNEYERVIVKPTSGAKGIGVVYVERSGDDFVTIEQTERSLFTRREFERWLEQWLEMEDLLVQPYVASRTKAGQPFDFRLHVQKGGQGQWVMTTIYPRIGQAGSIITNMSAGGATNELKFFLEHEFGTEAYDIARELEVFALQLAAHMDEVYEENFDELGIDIGLDPHRKFWLYEVNWRPGQPMLFRLELDVVRNMILYCKYLAAHSGQNKWRAQ